jgi:hypothetical protein
MSKKKGRRNYLIRKCGRATDINCSKHTGDPACVGCNWPQAKISLLRTVMTTKGSGNKIPQVTSPP